MLRELSLNQLVALDGGRVVEAWQQALGRALDDCEDRPGVKKPRTVTLVLSVVPTSKQSTDNSTRKIRCPSDRASEEADLAVLLGKPK